MQEERGGSAISEDFRRIMTDFGLFISRNDKTCVDILFLKLWNENEKFKVQNFFPIHHVVVRSH
jgi:ABC-type tungstate transport system permease subunit